MVNPSLNTFISLNHGCIPFLTTILSPSLQGEGGAMGSSDVPATVEEDGLPMVPLERSKVKLVTHGVFHQFPMVFPRKIILCFMMDFPPCSWRVTVDSVS